MLLNRIAPGSSQS
jgi:hypothetical protein